MIIGFYAIGLIGLLTHFLKQKVKGQTALAIRRWFAGHVKDTVLSLIMFTVVFASLYAAGQLSFMNAFMAGYMCDSLFARLEKKNV